MNEIIVKITSSSPIPIGKLKDVIEGAWDATVEVVSTTIKESDYVSWPYDGSNNTGYILSKATKIIWCIAYGKVRQTCLIEDEMDPERKQDSALTEKLAVILQDHLTKDSHVNERLSD